MRIILACICFIVLLSVLIYVYQKMIMKASSENVIPENMNILFSKNNILMIYTNPERTRFGFNTARLYVHAHLYQVVRWDSPKWMENNLQGKYPKSILEIHSIPERSHSMLQISRDNEVLYYKPVVDDGTSYEDPRLFTYRDCVYCICYKRSEKDGHRVILFPIENPETEIVLYYKHHKTIEKNWCPFEWKQRLLILYSIYPTLILECNVSTGICREWKRSNRFAPSSIADDFYYHLGTPPILIGKRMFGLMHRMFKKISYRNAFYELHPDTLEPSWPSSWFSIDPNILIQYGCGMRQRHAEGDIELVFGINDTAFSLLRLHPSELSRFLPPFSYDQFFSLPVFIISLKDSTRPAQDRVKKYFSNIKMTGIDGRQLDREMWRHSVGIPFPVNPLRTKGEVGCAASHINIWEKIRRQQIPWSIIFEDDILFPDGWEQKLSECLSIAFPDSFNSYDLVYIGNQIDVEKVVSPVMKLDTFCTHAYMISLQGAHKIVSELLPHAKDKASDDKYTGVVPIDCFLIEEMKSPECRLNWTCFVDVQHIRSPAFSVSEDARNTGLVHQDPQFISTTSDKIPENLS